MRALLTSILVATGVLLSLPATALADNSYKPASTMRAPNVDRTRMWSGRSGNWDTTGRTRYTVDGMRFSTWNSKNRVTGATKMGSTRNGQGYSSTSIGTMNRAGKTTSVKNSHKGPGEPRKKEGY